MNTQTLISNFDLNRSLSIFGYLSTCIDDNYCNEINRFTENQSELEYWNRHRYGRITYSILQKLCQYKGNDPNNYIVKQIVNTDCRSLSTPATMYGTERETLARNFST